MEPTNDVTVKACGLADVSAVLHVHAQRDARRDDVDVPVVTDVEHATWVRMMATTDLTVYLAEWRGEPVGTATLLLLPNLTYHCAPSAFVEAVVVALDHRRQGIATTIMRRVLTDSGAAGCNKVQLLSHKRHATDGAHRLYTSLGFEAEAEGFRFYHHR